MTDDDRQAGAAVADFVRAGMAAQLPRLRRFALGLTGNADDADEVVQAACEKALSGAERWVAGTRLDSWLYRVVHTVWLDELRRRKRRRNLTGLDEAMERASPSVLSGVEARLTLEEVRRMITELPSEQRAALLLVCVEEMSYREAAAVLDVPVGTVMSRLARARAQLAERLGRGAGRAADGTRG